jgi:hypothetical protein
MKCILLILLVSSLLCGCATLLPPYPEVHNDKLMTEIISDPPGAKIEINNQYVGDTPLTIHIQRQYVGGFDDAWQSLTITANPIYQGQYVQTKLIWRNVPTPTKIYFNMSLIPVPQQQQINVDVNKQ